MGESKSSGVAIEVESLSQSFGQVRAVVNVAFTVGTGEAVGLLGAHGSGKTTILRMLAGLLPPAAGRVCLNGYDLARERERAVQEVAAVVQGTWQLDEQCSIWESLLPAARVGAEGLLSELDLWRHRGRPVGTLSDGLRRQAALVYALGLGRPILLLDEPTLGLEERGARAIETHVERLSRERNVTMVIASCSFPWIQRLCDRVVVIRDGWLVADLPVKKTAALSQRAHYQIRVKGSLDEECAQWLGARSVTAIGDETIVSGLFLDQSALHGLLLKIRNLGLPLISVDRFETGLDQTMR